MLGTAHTPFSVEGARPDLHEFVMLEVQRLLSEGFPAQNSRGRPESASAVGSPSSCFCLVPELLNA
jgi:hypothetical protein